MKLSRLFLLSTLAFLTPAYALTGAETTNPDTIVLTEAMLIQNGVQYGRQNFVFDPQAKDMISGHAARPTDGKVSGKTQNGRYARWEKIKAGEKDYFRTDKLRGGALYIEYSSEKEKVMILEASGHTMALVNGEPREGDHYDFNFSGHPFVMKKGINTFYLTNGRFNRIRAYITEPYSEVMIKKKDLTIPDLVIEEKVPKWGSITLINASNKKQEDLIITCKVKNEKISTAVPALNKLCSKRVNFKIPYLINPEEGDEQVEITLTSPGKKVLDTYIFKIKVKPFKNNHDRTFISRIDRSVQYYSVTPGTDAGKEDQALFLSVHGAGVQARNQAWTYDAKDWGHIVAPTNRGPFGFAWEDWGRLDALEVLKEGKKLFNTDPALTYLTGHSMGGHGTWYLGATYPGLFAAIAPCAGYPDLLNYAGSESTDQDKNELEKMFERAGNTSRTLKMKLNYRDNGVFVFHGDADPVVSVEQARRMRSVLGNFHPDFTYYEYPGGTHWFGDISMDWPPIFDFFKLHKIPPGEEVNDLEFITASPGVSSVYHWIRVNQQVHPFKISSVKARVSDDSSGIVISTRNIHSFSVKNENGHFKYPLALEIDGKQLSVSGKQNNYLHFELIDGRWENSPATPSYEKGPHRYGGFKDAFRKNMIFVYGTSGTEEENRWNFNKARFDAETFAYRGNGSVEIISDREFADKEYPGRNIIIYGNADNNLAWDLLLEGSPVRAKNGSLKIGKKTLKGKDIACYFIRPRPGTHDNCVGVVSGTGLEGMHAAYPNQYFIAGTSFPDLSVFRMPESENEYESLVCAGFFGNDWSIENGDFSWNGK